MKLSLRLPEEIATGRCDDRRPSWDRMRPRHILAAILVAAVWGLNFVIIDVGLRDVPPLLLSCLRYAVASLPLIVLRGPRPAPWRWIIAAGACIGIVQFGLLFLGMDAGMPAGLSSVVIQT